jgi:hypothetical protein
VSRDGGTTARQPGRNGGTAAQRAGSRNGGMAARRAVVRWAWRLFRREWRQQAGVLTLLTVAVTATVAAAAAGYHLTSRPGAAGTWVEAAAGVFSVFAVSMLLIGLIAAAGFTVVAHRRQRQLGLLASIGAAPRHLRLVLLAHGAAVGATASAAGTVLGAVAWFAVTPRFETATGHRIDRWDLPWGQILVAVLLTILAATAAAWQPARAAARLPVTTALSARPPRPRRTRRSAVVAAVLVVLGVVAMRLVQRDRPSGGDVLEIIDVGLIVGGTLSIGIALLFVGPAAIRLLATAAARLPVAARLALRDLARHQARSSAALAAISVALAIPAAIVIGAKVLDQDGREDLVGLRAISTGAGALLALVILAMAVGLIRSEAAGDLRTLTATGATRHIRRTLTSVTAGGLALLGGLLGIAAAYTVILAGSSREQLTELARVPYAELAVIAFGVPLAALALGWLFAGREPRTLRPDQTI